MGSPKLSVAVKPLTEHRNPATVKIDRLPVPEVVRLFVEQDRLLISAVEACSSSIAKGVDLIVRAFRRGGRLVYIGAGTSGRLGILDASECPPTFGVASDMVVGLIAGGEVAVTQAVEGAEDDGPAAEVDLKRIFLKAEDVVIGISASGITPYVRAGLAFARTLGCGTGLLTCNPNGPFPETDVFLNPVAGPEVITGSTRLKSGTACKMVLNMLSSISMIQMGKVYENLMVDVKATNRKLQWRSVQIVMAGGRVSQEQAEALLEKTGGEVKTAIVVGRLGVTPEEARLKISAAKGFLYKALDEEAG